jgi:hypothetical protein
MMIWSVPIQSAARIVAVISDWSSDGSFEGIKRLPVKVEGKGLPDHCLDLRYSVSTLEAERVLI